MKRNRQMILSLYYFPPISSGSAFMTKSGVSQESLSAHSTHVLTHFVGQLSVEHINPVQWNKKAFERLVLTSQKKELVKALVTVHVKTSSSTDVIEGKGNGLIILLHGTNLW